MGLFITFEGIEGCGKTTQLQMAGDFLASHSIPLISTAEPGGTPLGRTIRDILLNRGPYVLSTGAELLLFCAARSQHIEEVIAPALSEGKVVLCDRFSDATLVYQGYGRGLNVEFIKAVNEFAIRGVKPDRTLLFDLPVEEGLARAFDRIARQQEASPEDRFEREEKAFHQRVREGYLQLAHQEPQRFRVINASQDIPAIHRDVCRHLETMIGECGHVV